jgi:hypothetical protein
MSAQNHLEGPPGTSISQGEVNESCPLSHSHRSEISESQGRPPPDFSHKQTVSQSGMEGPSPPLGLPGTKHQLDFSAHDGFGQARKVAGIKRSIAVHEADHILVRRHQSRPAGGAESANRLNDDMCAQVGSNFTRAIDRSVIDHQWMEPLRHAIEDPRDRPRFVKHGQDDLGHLENVATKRRARPANGLQIHNFHIHLALPRTSSDSANVSFAMCF